MQILTIITLPQRDIFMQTLRDVNHDTDLIVNANSDRMIPAKVSVSPMVDNISFTRKQSEHRDPDCR
ncbi:hypothetical protein [Klugiella xanthotipulae]|uniref:hypothetical protein n=1 Tax=Klugiella xanthotipulae TaxID=244735 RepID=UPI001476CBD1|nr:hypothetical protein [Klugiella xanthotipulae]